MTATMELLCERKPTRCLKIPLRSTEQIYLVFLVPTLISCIVYMVHFASDLVVAVEHFREHNPAWGLVTLAFMYTPAFTYFILTVSRPDWWMTEDQKLSRNALAWFTLQFCQLLVFPVFALYRFAGQIVVIVDAILLTGEERKKSLNVAAAPAAIELYFFLQAWFQAAPQAIFQLHLLLQDHHSDGDAERSHQSMAIHVLCVFMSIVVLATQTASFQRFESQKINGRKVPWAMWLKKYRAEELNSLEDKKPLVPPGQNTVPEQPKPTEERVLERQISTTPPLPPKNAQIIPPPAPLRGITSVAPLPVPEMPAPPRPDSIFREPEVEIAPEEPIFSIPQSDHSANKTWNILKMPTRKYSVKGIEEDDPVGKFTAFLWWFFFIFARIFAIALFFKFYPAALLGVLGVHYVLMVIYLFYHAKDHDATTFIVNFWLGLVYIVSIIEYRIKFKQAEKWLFFYYTFVVLQNGVITVTWYVLSDWDNFWYSYMFYAIFVSTGLCILSTCVYQVLFKPVKRRIYAS